MRGTCGKLSRVRAVEMVEETAQPRVVRKPLRPAECRSYMRRTLAREFPDIVEGLLKGAKSGSCQHVKLATELLNLRPGKKQTRKGPGPFEELLREMERREAEEAQSSASA